MMPTLIGLDLETTGIEYAEGHKIVEIAVVLYDALGNERGAFTQRYNPGRPIDPKAQAVHGITFEAVASCPTFDRDAIKISTLLSRATLLVAHNGKEFDLPFINHEFRLAGVPLVNVPLVDTMLEGRWATAFGKIPNLGELAFACGVPYDPEQAHGALYDVRVMMACYFHAAQKGFFTGPPPEERKAA
jgi:DNA polymerase-3 subunit epsilon